MFETGDIFALTIEIMNSTQNNLHLHQYLLLEVEGSYFFHPGWSSDPAYTDCRFSSGYHDFIQIIRFVWPVVDGSAAGLRFYLGYLDAETQELIGDIDSADFGYR